MIELKEKKREKQEIKTFNIKKAEKLLSLEKRIKNYFTLKEIKCVATSFNKESMQ